MAATISKDLVSRNITTSCIRFFFIPQGHILEQDADFDLPLGAGSICGAVAASQKENSD
jgi:ribonuclease HIII